MQHKNERKRKHSTHTHPKKTHTKWNEWDIFFVFMFYFISVFGGDGGNGSSGNDDGGCYISGCSFLFCILCKTILCFKRMDILELQGRREKKYAEWNSIQLKQHLLHFSGFWVAIWVWTWNSRIVRSKTDTRCTLYFVHVLYHEFC